MVTGGLDPGAEHTEKLELEDKKWSKWTVLQNGNLPGNARIYGLRLATVDNKVFSFGKIWKCFFNHL